MHTRLPPSAPRKFELHALSDRQFAGHSFPLSVCVSVSLLASCWGPVILIARTGRRCYDRE
jgi:hypothetical protein